MARLGLALAGGFSAAVLSEGARIVKSTGGVSSPKWSDQIDGLVSGVESELKKLGKRGITSVSIVTDAIKEAVGSRNDLNKVALYRLSSPEGQDCPSLLEDTLAKQILTMHVVSGGHGFDGRIIGQPDPEEIQACFNRDKESHSIGAYVISSPFSILFPDQEVAARDVLERSGAGTGNVWISSEVSSIPSIMDRETTAILSASTSHIIGEMEDAVKSKLADFGSNPKVYFGRNDGCVIASDLAKRFPLETAWGIQGHSTSGACRALKASKCLVLGQNSKSTWLAAAEKAGRPIMRRIAYLGDMLVQVSTPMIAEFDNSAPEETKKSAFQLMSNLSGVETAVVTGLSLHDGFVFPTKKIRNAEEITALNATQADVSWESSMCVPKDSDVREAERSLRNAIKQKMQMAGAARASTRLSRLDLKPGYNLPEGAMTLSVQATGKRL